MYADRLPTAVRQLLTDLCVVIWGYAWIRGALALRDLIADLAGPGLQLQGAGTSMADNLAEAGGKVGRVPIVGDELTAPFTRAGEAARSIAEAGQRQQEIVGTLSWVLPVAVLAVPLGLVLFLWLPLRLRWMRRAGVASAVRDQPAGRDLLALRALATRPLSELTRLGPDIAQSWRNGDRAAVEALAALE
jgi:hypothetical protein